MDNNNSEIEWLQEQLEHYKYQIDFENSFDLKCEITVIYARIAISALELSIKALEKQVPVKVVETENCKYKCPNCTSIVDGYYCPTCGQKLNWDWS